MNLEGVMIEDRKQDTLLYAGRMQVRITDWFFFKDKAELKYVGMEHAIIYLNRTDSVWNYQFFQDYFFGGGGGGKKEGIAFDLKKMKLENIILFKKDEWLGENIYLQLKTFDLDANEINFNTKKVDINTLSFTEPLFFTKNYPGLKPKTVKKEPEEETNGETKTDSLLKWNIAGWIVHIDQVKIDNGTFKNQKYSDNPYNNYFDGRNIDFTSINGTFSNLDWNKDTITVKLDLKAKERSGFEVKSMLADMRLHPKAMEFSKMEIKTNKSVLKDFFAMRFDDFSDMNDYIHRVRMESNFTGTFIDSDDIAFFAPALKSWKKRITITGKIKGTVDDLLANSIEVMAGNNTILKGDVSLSGLPDINQTFIDFKANDFRTTYADAVTFFPSLRQITNPRLQNISYINFNGNFTGFIRDFVTFGTIHTNLGTLTSDLNMKLPLGKEPVYSGNIASADFQLGAFLNNSSIGTISFEGKVKGQGLQWQSLNADIDAVIKQVQYNNYHYENIVAKGSLKKKLFNGVGSVNDSNVVFDLEGLVDFTGKIPRFDFFADVKKINLKPLNLVNENYSFSGKLDFDFSSNNIDNFLGDAKITDAELTKDGKKIAVDSFVVAAWNVNGVKNLTAKSNEFEGFITGDYTLKDLPDAFKLFLNKYYPSYIKEPRNKIRNESFTFDFRTRYVDDYLQLIDSNITGFNNSHISGKLNLGENQLQLNAEVPSFSYMGYSFQNITINSKGDLQKLELNAVVDNASINDSLNLPFTKIDIIAQNDLSDIHVLTVSNNKTIPEANIKAQVRTYSDGVGIRFDSSRFVMNDKTWTIEKDGELEFRSNTVSSGQVTLREGNQEIKLNTKPSDIGNWNDLKIDLKNINIGDISPYLLKHNRVEGAVTGNITIEDPNKTFNVVADLQTEELRLDNDSIGQVKTHVTYNNKTGELKANGQTLNPDQKLNFDLALFLKDPENLKEDMISITPENYPVKIAERFIGTLFSNLDGYATGQLKIIGEGDKRKYVGLMKLHDAGLKVKFTQCYYKIMDTEIEFKPDALDLGTMTLLDTVTGNTASITRGVLKHSNWKNMQFDIRATVDNRPMLLLNTGPRDNSSFYGRAKGTGTFSISGPQGNMKIKITGAASSTDSSYITIPSSESRESGIADFLIERKYGRELKDYSFNSNETNISYDVELIANPMVNMRVVLDELTKDEIIGRGFGNLRISSGTTEPLTIHGRYNITDGKYVFTFQSVFKRPFELKKDAVNFIEWSGDPYKANIRLEAQYKASKVSFAPLANSFSLDNRVLSAREDVYVTALLTGDLFKPNIEFSLDFPENSIVNSDQTLSFNIQQLQNNSNELNKQVSYLIVFNSFAPVENGLSGSSIGSTLSEFATSTVSGIISNVINNELNKRLAQILKSDKYKVNFSGSLYNKNPFGEGGSSSFALGSSFGLSFSGPLFTDRIIFSVGGNLDAPLQSDVQQEVQLLPDITIEVLINKSGTVRATFFHKQNIDYLTGTTGTTNTKSQRTGASLAYKKDFNHLGDLFNKKKRNKPLPKPAASKEEEK